MNNDGDILGGFIVGIIVGVVVGIIMCSIIDHKMAIEHNIGHYNTINGDFQWNWETNK